MTEASSAGVTLTIVTPTLNAERYLPTCLERIEQATGVVVEHLVVDGGSVDGTRALATKGAAVTWVERPDRTILFTSHNLDQVQRLCSRCLVLEAGRVLYLGKC